jgi:hypothetical protein
MHSHRTAREYTKQLFAIDKCIVVSLTLTTRITLKFHSFRSDSTKLQAFLFVTVLCCLICVECVLISIYSLIFSISAAVGGVGLDLMLS